MSKKLMIGLSILAVTFLVVQLVPYGRDHTNPPVVQEPEWDSPQTRALVKRTCFDCHSNETVWPWYSNIAPISWLVQHDVEDGRNHMNLSEFHREQKHAHEAAEEVEEGEMPMAIYPPLHPEAQLTAEEKKALIAGLKATLGKDKD